MPSFSSISIFATLALAAFTSALPTANPGVDVEVRTETLAARQASNVLTDLLDTLTGLPIISSYFSDILIAN